VNFFVCRQLQAQAPYQSHNYSHFNQQPYSLSYFPSSYSNYSYLNTYPSALPTSSVPYNPSSRTHLVHTEYGDLDQYLLGIALKISKLDYDSRHKQDVASRDMLEERLKAVGMKMKREILGDGNCQFAAISDQLTDSLNFTDNYREVAVDWLRKNREKKLANGAKIQDYNWEFDNFDAYCNQLAKKGVWGDHVSLIALAESLRIKIVIISNVQCTGNNYVTTVIPLNGIFSKVINLCHWAEYHYGSITFINNVNK